ncbi:MAG TPA: hypothetical protein DCZ72_10860 [Armatimonadetes bacterium]|nr:hypothetical protein [Armatimonadota bacterium]
MTQPDPSLAEGALLAGCFLVRRVLAVDDEATLLAAVDDSSGRPAWRVLLARRAELPLDARTAGIQLPSCANLLQRFEHGAYQVSVLAVNGVQTLTETAARSNDAWLLEALAQVPPVLADLARSGYDLGQVRASHLAVVPGSTALTYIGPLVPAGETNAETALARVRADLLAAGGRWSEEIAGALTAWAGAPHLASADVLRGLARWREPADLRADVAVRSTTGAYRRRNEDSVLHCLQRLVTGSQPAAWELCAIADGIGGHRGGREASQAALQTLAATLHLAGQASSGTSVWDDNALVVDLLTASLEEAQQAVRGLAAQGETRTPGCTLTATLRVGRRLFLLHVGDSRAYLWREGRLEQLTRDHTVAQDLVDDGEIAAADARSHAQGHVLTQALGQTGSPSPQIRLRLLRPGDRLLLCSDGLIEPLRQERVAELLGTRGTAAQIASRLERAALDGGTRDNVSTLVCLLTAEGDHA